MQVPFRYIVLQPNQIVYKYEDLLHLQYSLKMLCTQILDFIKRGHKTAECDKCGLKCISTFCWQWMNNSYKILGSTVKVKLLFMVSCLLMNKIKYDLICLSIYL